MPTYRPPYVGLQYSEALTDAYVHTPADDPVLVTLELHHPDWAEPVRVVNDWETLDATLEADAPNDPSIEVAFAGIPFTFSRPAETDSGAPAAVTISVDNLSTIVTQMIMEVQESEEPIYVLIRTYLRTDTSAPHELPVLKMWVQSPVQIDSSTARLTCSFGDLTNRRFPRLLWRRFSTVSPCFDETFSAGLAAYSTVSGTNAAFGTVTSPYGQALAISIGGPSVSSIQRTFTPRDVQSIAFKFKLTSLNSDDAGILQLYAGAALAFLFTPRRELAFSAGTGHPFGSVGISASSTSFGAITLAINTWYQVEVFCDVSTDLVITRISDSVVMSTTNVGNLSALIAGVDSLRFSVDEGGATLSEDQYADIHICPAVA